MDVPYKLQERMRFGKAHDGEGGQMKGASLTKGTKRCVIAIKDSAQAERLITLEAKCASKESMWCDKLC